LHCIGEKRWVRHHHREPQAWGKLLRVRRHGKNKTLFR
jgi:hypothetical protein